MSQAPTFPVKAMCILWPSFLMAGACEALLFCFIEPSSLVWFGSELDSAGLMAFYSVTFFVFWALISTSSAMTQLLLTLPTEPEAARRRSAPSWPN